MTVGLFRAIVVIVLVGGAYAAWKHHEGAAARAEHSAEEALSPNGFESVPLDGNSNSVVIFAPLTKQEKEALAKAGSTKNVPVISAKR